jgi:hypothetical protein
MAETIEWVPPHKRLPKDGEDVLLCFFDSDGKSHVKDVECELTDGNPEWYVGDGGEMVTRGVIAWASMPKGP